MTSSETQIASFFAQYEPATAKLGKALRKKLRARLPGMSEVVYVYERQKSLVIAYSPTGQGYEALCSLAVDPRGVRLYFAGGPKLSKSDPHKLLQGTGGKVRYVVLNSIADYERAEIEALMTAALKLADVRLDADAKGTVILKAAEQKQRASRTAKKTRSAATRGKPKARR